MKLFITGATGSIGPSLLKDLKQFAQVTSLSRNQPKELGDNIEWIKGDLNDFTIEELSKLLNGVEVILHMANLSKTNPEADQRVSQNLAKAAKACKVPHFFYVSTIRVYGNVFGLIDETFRPTPILSDQYAVSKLKIESELSRFFLGSATQLRILRVGHVISDQSLNRLPRKLNFLFLMLRGRSYPHYIHVDEICQCFKFLIKQRDKIKCTIYNITREHSAKKNTYLELYPHSILLDFVALPKFISKTINQFSDYSRGAHGSKIVEINLKKEGFAFETLILEQVLNKYGNISC